MFKLFSFLSLFLAACISTAPINTFPVEVSECNNAAACHAVYIHFSDQLSKHDCDNSKLSCESLIRDMNAAKTKYEALETQEQLTEARVGETTEALRQKALKERKAQEEAARQEAFVLKAQFCRETEAQRLQAFQNWEEFSELYKKNAVWVARNCRKQQTQKQVCVISEGHKTCNIETGSVILNCGSNPRPKKLDGSRLNDADILNEDFGADKEIVKKLADDVELASKQDIECNALK